MIELYTWHDKERRATDSAQDIPFLSTYVTLVTPRIPQIVLHFPCTYAQDCNLIAHTLAHSAYNQGQWSIAVASQRPISPLGWNILETNFTEGGLFGYSSENSIFNLNVPVAEKVGHV